jgi:nitroreductase
MKKGGLMTARTTPSHHGVKEAQNAQYPNTTLKLLMERASCRNFSKRVISKRVMDAILEAGIHAPTGGNLQPYSIIRIVSSRKRARLAKMCGQSFMAKAPVHLLFCIDYHRLQRWAEIETAPFSATCSFRHFWIAFQDTIICAQNICTAADSLGLGSVYIGTVMEFIPDTRIMFGLPKGVLPVVLLCLGYPAVKPLVRRKLGIEMIVHDERYHEMSDRRLRKVFEKKYPNVRIEVTDDRLKRIRKVCNRVHGRTFAKKCIETIEQNGYINAVQRYFGLHYVADLMPTDNQEFVRTMKRAGFTWLEKYKPQKTRR